MIYLTSALALMVCYYAYIYALEPFKEWGQAQINKKKNAELAEPKATAITEPLQTYYAGQAAFDLPISFSVPPPSISIRLDGPEAGGRILFMESAPLPSGVENSELKSDFERLILAEKPERAILKSGETEDISAEFGRPALMIALTCENMFGEVLMNELTSFMLDDFKDALDSMVPKFGGNEPKAETGQQTKEKFTSPVIEGLPSPEYLSLNMVLDEGNHRLFFESINSLKEGQNDDPLFLEERKTEFVGLVKKIRPLYQWTGKNTKPQKDTLATAYGYFKQPDKGELSSTYDLEPNYKLKQGSNKQHERDELKFKISIRTTPGLGCSHQTRNTSSRSLGDHIGCEYSSFYSRIKTDKWVRPANLRSVRFDRSWTDGCDRETEIKAPHFSMSMKYSETRIDDGQVVYDELAYLKGVWEILLNSIHRVE